MKKNNIIPRKIKTRFTFIDTDFKPEEDQERQLIILGFEYSPENVQIAKLLFAENVELVID